MKFPMAHYTYQVGDTVTVEPVQKSWPSALTMIVIALAGYSLAPYLTKKAKKVFGR